MFTLNKMKVPTAQHFLRSWLVAAALAVTCGVQAQTFKTPNIGNIGRAATPAEVKAWDIDVRPDFKGLPVGAGSVAKGQQVWESKCASCHGTFGESNEVFTPIIGGTTKDDQKTGHVASLKGDKQPQRTTIMKVATVSTLWDYINRAMPWNAPKSLSTEEVFAVTAYILNMAEIVPDDFVLSDKNIAEVQAKMPNRNGMTTQHGMFAMKGKGDVRNVLCMNNCETGAKVSSFLPDYARNAHGNLAEQNRVMGPVRGADTTRPAPTEKLKPSKAAPVPVVTAPAKVLDGGALLKKNSCTACHAQNSKMVGPSFAEIQAKYASAANGEQTLVAKVKAGGQGVWGQIPMPAQGHLPESEIQSMVRWILQGK